MYKSFTLRSFIPHINLIHGDQQHLHTLHSGHAACNGFTSGIYNTGSGPHPMSNKCLCSRGWWHCSIVDKILLWFFLLERECLILLMHDLDANGGSGLVSLLIHCSHFRLLVLLRISSNCSHVFPIICTAHYHPRKAWWRISVMC